MLLATITHDLPTQFHAHNSRPKKSLTTNPKIPIVKKLSHENPESYKS
jgi:hypothetical protein